MKTGFLVGIRKLRIWCPNPSEGAGFFGSLQGVGAAASQNSPQPHWVDILTKELINSVDGLGEGRLQGSL